MTLNATAILDALQSHALASGRFERVNTHEPRSVPGTGLTAALWADDIVPLPEASGLAATSVRITFILRIFSSLRYEPADMLDPNMIDAVDTLLTAYSGDFELGGNARNIDILGGNGIALAARAGYLPMDGAPMRVYTITIPVIVNDAWPQSP